MPKLGILGGGGGRLVVATKCCNAKRPSPSSITGLRACKLRSVLKLLAVMCHKPLKNYSAAVN